MSLLPELAVVFPCFFGFERSFWSGWVELGIQRWCFGALWHGRNQKRPPGIPWSWISAAVRDLMKNLG
ncbi:hypothetical protein ACT3UQ_19645, partial [Glutamicibacter sp. AOP12-B1-11]|uniref:hypothetical protein n=1 Tax=Micrococcaceae TaxID=1268 RepID=UPI001C615047